jgi:predicted metal-dependent RNase
MGEGEIKLGFKVITFCIIDFSIGCNVFIINIPETHILVDIGTKLAKREEQFPAVWISLVMRKKKYRGV